MLMFSEKARKCTGRSPASHTDRSSEALNARRLATPRCAQKAVGQVLDGALQRARPGSAITVGWSRPTRGAIRIAIADSGSPVSTWVAPSGPRKAPAPRPKWFPETTPALPSGSRLDAAGGSDAPRFPVGTGAMGLEVASSLLDGVGGRLHVTSPWGGWEVQGGGRAAGSGSLAEIWVPEARGGERSPGR